MAQTPDRVSNKNGKMATPKVNLGGPNPVFRSDALHQIYKERERAHSGMVREEEDARQRIAFNELNNLTGGRLRSVTDRLHPGIINLAKGLPPKE